MSAKITNVTGLKPYSVLLTYDGSDGGTYTFYDFVHAEHPVDAVRKAVAAFQKADDLDDEAIAELNIEAELVLPGHIVGLNPESEEQYW